MSWPLSGVHLNPNPCISTTLHYTVLHFTALYFTTLYNTVLHTELNPKPGAADYYFGWFLFYWAAEFVGAAMAATIFIALRPGEFEGFFFLQKIHLFLKLSYWASF